MPPVNALLIDDDDLSLDVLAQMLSVLNIQCSTVSDPTTLAGQDLSGFDIVFLDLEMPQMDGYQTLAMLRQDNGVTAPVIAYTVHSNEMGNARALGFDSFIGKPLRDNRFGDQMSRLLSGKSVWEAV